ncbi:DUF4328 domain-containing protein [Pyxidicoccus fallax]|uniref:DUF4328 domain-containing protein n=1 Tax=Pyxidicoccus fallax TaxID=394095 RepID=A0A848LTL0_9BACT|nr:DUF4328 domain-containing protein [Pyxidicoccus fallax]NPC82373.1 DUF4328 domain-containing protein [Pyxidicoccus fallax]
MGTQTLSFTAVDARPPTRSELPSGRLRAWLAMGFLGLLACESLARVGANDWLLTRAGGGLPPHADSERYESLALMLALPALLGVVGGAIAFIGWLYQVERNANVLGPGQEEPRRWFFPLFNLIKPYHAVRDVVADVKEALQGRRLLVAWGTGVLLQFVLNRAAELLWLVGTRTPSSSPWGCSPPSSPSCSPWRPRCWASASSARSSASSTRAGPGPPTPPEPRRLRPTAPRVRRGRHCAVAPPSMTNSAPVISFDSSEAR